MCQVRSLLPQFLIALQRIWLLRLGGARPGIKGRHRKTAGQRADAAVQQQSVDEGPCLKPVEEGLSRQGSQLHTSAGGDKEGVEGYKLGPGSGGGGSLKSAQIGSVVQCLSAVATESASRNWAEECVAGEGVSKGSSVLFREPNSAGGKEKEAVVLVQGLEAVVMEKRPLCGVVERGTPVVKSSSLVRPLISAPVSKGKAKGKSLQSSK